MAVNNYLNIEPLSLEIADEMTEKMTDSNSFDGVILEEKLTHNIKYGFIVITHLMTFFEGFLNTVMNRCMAVNDDKQLRKSIDEKLEILCANYNKNIQDVKRLRNYQTYKRIKRVRNEMIHYKRSYVGESTGFPRLELGHSYADTLFTKKEMRKCICGFVRLTDEIAELFGLKTYHQIPVITCDGRDGLVNYVYDPEEISIDPYRQDDTQQSITYGFIPVEDDELYNNYNSKDLFAERDNCYQRCRSIEQTICYNSIAIDDEALNTYYCLNNQLIKINEEIEKRILNREKRMSFFLWTAFGDCQLYPMVKRPKGCVDVMLYRKYEVLAQPQLIAVSNVPYAENTLLKDVFIQIGLGDQTFNIMDRASGGYVYIEVPFYDDGELVHWNLTYKNITVDQYLGAYKCDAICITPFDYHYTGGIGFAASELLRELLDYANQFMINNPFLGGILTSIIATQIIDGVKSCVKAIKDFSDRGVSYSSAVKYLETQSEWKEEVLLKKFQVDTLDHLEFMMFSFGYIKENGIYRAINDKGPEQGNKTAHK